MSFRLPANWQRAAVTFFGPVQELAKALCMAGNDVEITVKQAKRSNPQNKKLHAMLGDIASQKEWAGKKRDTDTWKRLMVAAWCRARHEPVEFLPAIDGHGVDIVFRRTSEMTKQEVAELIEYVYAWCAQNDVELSEPWTDPETGEILTTKRTK